MSFRWKPVFAALIVAIVLLASFSVLQFNNIGLMEVEQKKLQDKVDQLASYAASTLPSMSFLRDVIQLDLTKYDVELLSNTQTELEGVIQQSLVYSLKSADSSMTVNMLFKKNMLSSYSVSLLGGTPIYEGPQPFKILDSAKWLIQKMTSYEHEPYFVQMNTTLYQFNEASSITLQQGNLKFNLSTAGTITTMQWYYTENDVDFPLKSLKLTFDGLTLKELDDSYFLYSIGNANVNINQAEAIQLAKTAIQGYTWFSGGQQVSGYTVQDASAVFDPSPRENPLALVPHWTVTLYLTNLPASTNINRLSVGVWADTGKTEPVRALSG